VEQGTRQVQALLHAAGIGFDPVVSAILQSHQFQQFSDARASLIRGHGVQFGEITQILNSGQASVKSARATEGEANVFAYFPGVLQNILTKNMNAAAGGDEQRGEHFHGSGLAGAVWTQQTKEFSFIYVEGDAAHRLGGARGALQEAVFRLKSLNQ